MKMFRRGMSYRFFDCCIICFFSAIVPWVELSPIIRIIAALPVAAIIAWLLECRADLVTIADDVTVPDGISIYSIESEKDEYLLADVFADIADNITLSSERVYCVCSPSASSGKSTMAVALVCHLQKKGCQSVLVNADSERFEPAEYSEMAKEHDQSIQVLGPMGRSEINAVISPILEEPQGNIVIDYGPIEKERLVDVYGQAFSFCMIAPRQISRRDLHDWLGTLAVNSKQTVLVFNAGASGKNSYLGCYQAAKAYQ